MSDPSKKPEKHSPEDSEASAPRPVIDPDLCKGCGRCIVACPQKVLRFSDCLNRQGVKPAEYIGKGCTGCAICYYNCPEIYALEVRGIPNRAAKKAQPKK